MMMESVNSKTMTRTAPWPLGPRRAGRGHASGSAVVLHVTYELERGGTPQMVVNLARCSHRRGARHMVCAWRVGGPLARALETEGVPVFLPRGAPRIVRPPIAIAEIAALVRRHRVDVIHGHMWDGAVMAFGAS